MGDFKDDANACREPYGTYFLSDTPMTCTGYGKYVDAYVCKNLDITYCWESDDDTCSACTDLYYYSSSNPLKSCTFNAEDKTHGYCLTGFCRNNNCYVKKVAVVLSNMPESDKMKTG